ncbi:MAG: hypothetical protein NZM42_12650 [Gemmatales bacterium]|nr:hypothetical protein [Gemmatales bacterium]MDW8224188.1 hypothetical protein [Gemmatales bacterium]
MSQMNDGQPSKADRRPNKTILFAAVLLIAMLIGAGLLVSGGVIEAFNSMAGQPGVTEQILLAEGAVDLDVTAFAALAEQASRRAGQLTPEATLRQAVLEPKTATFIFTDAGATQEFAVRIPIGKARPGPDQATVEEIELGAARYVGRPASGMTLDKLKVGPDRVRQAITQHAPGCTFSHAVLHPEGDTLIWTAFCTAKDGLVSGRMDSQTGVFHLEPAAPWPSVATPAP